ncbi:MAG: hypothetical protein A3H06_02285 [Candidatus Colwellbacteria bacterium RIFCSPLOWO2_12_FULL_44_13]|uniref:FAD-binding FR-type domain-containing protein n=3 Tax=Candidatus Colwelliibacteriota TaxID=1817904 RepID=A0A1G1Z5L6_9BACT|nr:MAG: hypothetical protein A3F24_01355 [Candidatus Colwellbacteria bacterium RIFCSPHIGHO2_12_FULL_44_17]OGY59913.1 MAG: hypothetical protein A3I31_02030 [Candidatus Colwellbacteria bacterium RIFCSPLOWO2_02_FULL_44_20b]OGY61772.1 MAG: hypothetical protein A3H06_02285 [Candidatus Colwellbacteria bacterium RIFCSPLOWO2_12_FULL_44_13]
MYRLVLYGLIALTLVSFILTMTGNLRYEWEILAMIYSLASLLLSSYVSNLVFSKVFKVPVNVESFLITALILFLILSPASSPKELAIIALAGAIAMASKFLLAPSRKHIFNPAAFSAFVLYVTGLGGAVWWVGDPTMIPFIGIVGALVIRKIRRFWMFAAFACAWLVSVSLTGVHFGAIFLNPSALLSAIGPTLFFGTIMLTEPMTTPGTRKLHIAYGALAGVLLNVSFKIGPIVLIPEIVLMISNVLSYVTSVRKKFSMSLVERKEISKNVHEFIFNPDGRFSFKSGQYLEWTLPHKRPDVRGNRRYFTIASSPTEGTIKLGVKFNNPPSSFKKHLLEMERGSSIFAGQLGGDFVLPRDKSKKLVFLAGGIGVTPFRSMVKYLLDKEEKRDITLFYAAKSEEEVAYKELFSEAKDKIGLKVRYIVGQVVTKEFIEREVKDFKNHVYYISGPEAMVTAFKKMLSAIGVPKLKIITDYFPGFT